jgi:peptidyl-prolyl cis-trans isomerase C
MRLSRFVAGAGLAAVTLAVVPPPAQADGADQQVVLTVGEESLTVADVEQRLNAVPAFQLRTFGKTPDEVRKAFVKRVLVPELLHEQEAEREHLDRAPEVRARVSGVLQDAMHRALKVEVARSAPVSDADVKAYFEAHKKKYNSPERLRLWRILVKSKADAEKILGEVRAPGGLEHWITLCGTSSLDKATALRNGDLGFVAPDGSTDKPRVKVDAALFAAADKVKDGAFVTEPVREGSNWAVVWRRGSLPATHRKLADEDHSIRQVLFRKKVLDATKNLITQLRTEYLRDVDSALLDYLHIDASADITARDRPGIVPRGPATVTPRPRATAPPEPVP